MVFTRVVLLETNIFTGAPFPLMTCCTATRHARITTRAGRHKEPMVASERCCKCTGSIWGLPFTAEQRWRGRGQAGGRRYPDYCGTGAVNSERSFVAHAAHAARKGARADGDSRRCCRASPLVARRKPTSPAISGSRSPEAAGRGSTQQPTLRLCGFALPTCRSEPRAGDSNLRS